jgi:hypothetical protein
MYITKEEELVLSINKNKEKKTVGGSFKYNA